MNPLKTVLSNPLTTLWGLTPLIPYGLHTLGWWPEVIPLPPIEQVWPFVMASIGLGASAKDGTK